MAASTNTSLEGLCGSNVEPASAGPSRACRVSTAVNKNSADKPFVGPKEGMTANLNLRTSNHLTLPTRLNTRFLIDPSVEDRYGPLSQGEGGLMATQDDDDILELHATQELLDLAEERALEAFLDEPSPSPPRIVRIVSTSPDSTTPVAPRKARGFSCTPNIDQPANGIGPEVPPPNYQPGVREACLSRGRGRGQCRGVPRGYGGPTHPRLPRQLGTPAATITSSPPCLPGPGIPTARRPPPPPTSRGNNPQWGVSTAVPSLPPTSSKRSVAFIPNATISEKQTCGAFPRDHPLFASAIHLASPPPSPKMAGPASQDVTRHQGQASNTAEELPLPLPIADEGFQLDGFVDEYVLELEEEHPLPELGDVSPYLPPPSSVGLVSEHIASAQEGALVHQADYDLPPKGPVPFSQLRIKRRVYSGRKKTVQRRASRIRKYRASIGLPPSYNYDFFQATYHGDAKP